MLSTAWHTTAIGTCSLAAKLYIALAANSPEPCTSCSIIRFSPSAHRNDLWLCASCSIPQTCCGPPSALAIISFHCMQPSEKPESLFHDQRLLLYSARLTMAEDLVFMAHMYLDNGLHMSTLAANCAKRDSISSKATLYMYLDSELRSSRKGWCVWKA